MTETIPASNSELPWDSFDSAEYFRHNYDSLREEDRTILEIVRDFFAATARNGLRGIDVGAGTNLYPALAMLPWCDEITLLDRSASNVKWLQQEKKNYKPSWDPFWDLLQKNPKYSDVLDPRTELRNRISVIHGDVFELQPGHWNIGTMFFVACSFSALREEFDRAVGCFLDALAPGSPFAIAYMEQSEGYHVGGKQFPAVSVTTDHVHKHLSGRVDHLNVERVPHGEERIREGYTGMLVAHGQTREAVRTPLAT